MGASDWAGEMVGRLEAEFGIDPERAVRITTLVRLFVSPPRYEGVFEQGEESWRTQQRLFIEELPETLREQPGGTVEERWNNFVVERGYQSRTDAGVYLRPWSEYDGEGAPPGVSKSP